MPPADAAEAFAAIQEVLARYFDGLHHSDAESLAGVFHPRALYATATDGSLLALDLERYLAIVAERPAPSSRGERRTDAIESIELAGPVTALARVRCSIGPKHYTDLLTLVRVDDRWQIIAKVFHHELMGEDGTRVATDPSASECPCPT